jgi:hypothetical protein
MVPDPSDVPLLITVSRCSSAGVMFDDAGAASTPKTGLVKTSRRDVNHILELAAAAGDLADAETATIPLSYISSTNAKMDQCETAIFFCACGRPIKERRRRCRPCGMKAAWVEADGNQIKQPLGKEKHF